MVASEDCGQKRKLMAQDGAMKVESMRLAVDWMKEEKGREESRTWCEILAWMAGEGVASSSETEPPGKAEDPGEVLNHVEIGVPRGWGSGWTLRGGIDGEKREEDWVQDPEW